MFRYFRAIWYFCTGRFSAAADAWNGNKYVMAATYDTAISKGQERFSTVRDAVAKLMGISNGRVEEIKSLNTQQERLVRVKAGALAAMQKCINDLRTGGVSQQDIEKNPDFNKHKNAYKDASSTLEQVEARIKEKEADLEERKKQIETYKLELQQMQRQQEALVEEKHEAIADVAISQQQQSISDVLNGIAESTIDKDLASVREARKQANEKAKISAELAGNNAKLAENEYLNLATSSQADKELDGLLNWGDEKSEKTPLADAKVSE